MDLDLLKGDDLFRHAMLGRLKSDCEYYLGYGNRSVRRLWAGGEREQIETMKALYNSFGENDKPQYLTWEDILEYERRMVPLTFAQWLSHNHSLTEEQLKVVSKDYGEDAEDYIQSKHHDYSVYLKEHGFSTIVG